MSESLLDNLTFEQSLAEIERLEQRFLTVEQLESKYGKGREAAIMPDAKPPEPADKSKQTA